MFIQIYDQNVMQVGVIDVFTSLIWTKRYNETGDFKVTIPLDGPIPDFLVYDMFSIDHFVTLSEDLEPGYYMIIETIEVNQEETGGNTLTISGRSLEALLERRIVWDKTIYTSKKTEVIVKDLLEKAFINPAITDRKMQNFVYEEPEEGLEFPNVDTEFDGEDLLDIIITLCSENHHSMSVRYLDGKFVYRTYTGMDRSHDQSKNDEVLYSADYDTLLSSNYLESIKNYKNVVQVSDSTGSKKAVVGEASGISRREYRVTPQNVTNQASLKAYGNKALYENSKTAILDGTSTNDVYVYGLDIFVGDIVQFRNDYGIESRSRITEYIYSEDTSGVNNYPTFTVIDQKGA